MKKTATQTSKSCFPAPRDSGKPFFGQSIAHPRVPAIQPKPTVNAPGSAGSAVSPGFESSLRSARSAGRPLPRDTRHFMESRFGTNFSSVNIHTDRKAAQLDRKSVVQGQGVSVRVDIGGRRYMKKNKTNNK